jgi:uncharacterized Zn finger protein
VPSIQPQNSFTSWWANRWLGLFLLLQRYPSSFSLRRGGFEAQRSEALGYADAKCGRVHDPGVEGGAASAIVVARDPRSSFGPRIEIAPLPGPVWAQAIERLAARSQLLAELLSGRLPAEISSIFRDTGADLFPHSNEEMKASCTCRLTAPCAHVAALHYVLADAFDRDPWLLFELRGMPREAILTRAHALRRAGLASPLASAGEPVTLPEQSYDRCPQPLPDAAALPAVPEQPASALRALPEPEDWPEDEHPADLLAPVLDAASRQAHRLIEQPGLIRSIAPAPAVDPLLERVQRLPPFSYKETALDLIECVTLARRAGRGDDPIEAMEAFTRQLARPEPRLDPWRKAWVTAVLRGQEPVQLSWEVRELAEGVRTAALLALIPGRPTALAWVSHADDATLKNRRKAERALLAGLDALVPGGAAIEIVAPREADDDSLEEYLDILGWDHALLDHKGRPARKLSPTLRALLARRGEGASCFTVPEPRVAPEMLVGVAARPLDRILWLQVIAREIVRELGGDRLDALPSMDDRQATDWLSSAAERLASAPWLLGLFRRPRAR